MIKLCKYLSETQKIIAVFNEVTKLKIQNIAQQLFTPKIEEIVQAFEVAAH